jgi:hypothetical protein
MRIKPKGRKIYRQKTGLERLQDVRSHLVSAVGTLIAVALMVLLGYSIGKPVIQFMQDSKLLAVPNEVGETLPVTEPVTEPPTEAVSETIPAETEPPVRETLVMRGYILEPSALISQSPFEEAVAAIPEGTTHVFVPLKAKGGYLYYATTLQDAAKSGAVKAALPLQTIYDAIEAKGVEPVALIDLLNDPVYPQSFPDAGYRYAGTSELWLDAPAESGGKPRLSPFSDMTLDYLGNLAAEIKEAGFKSIACDGLCFPAFSEEDLARMDSRIGQDARYTALTDCVRAMQTAATHVRFYTVISGTDILSNRNEALAASESLDLEAVICRVDSLSASNIDMLRTLPEEHPVIFAWEDVPVPESEKSYILTSGDL